MASAERSTIFVTNKGLAVDFLLRFLRRPDQRRPLLGNRFSARPDAITSTEGDAAWCGVEKIIGSSARTRTWNPSVNSRMLYH